MKIKNNRKTQKIFNLLLVVGILVPMLSCSSSSNQSTVNRGTPQNTLTEEKPTVSPTPSDPLEVFYGAWEVNKGGSAGIEKWNFKRATKKDGDYVGKITDLNNNDMYDYTIKPKPDNATSGTIGLVGMSSMFSVGSGKTLDYEVTDNGNKITLKDNPEIVLKRDSGNADIQQAADKIVSLSPWKLNLEAAKQMGFSGDTVVNFKTPTKYSNGYGGTMEITDSTGKTENRNYIITSKTEITLKDSVGEKLATYKLETDDLLIIKYKDEPGILSLSR
ncbi:hypothetical protein BH10ACI1_BH10ACI1_27150 [soil metagenome]